jgi:diphthamide synthase (EF-2-diphthine--ammonia ligase)
VNETYLDKSFAGRIIDEDFIKDLPENVDVCGENGEFLLLPLTDLFLKSR